MQVSIIIPVYNRASIVVDTLNSVVAQTHRPLQVVLVDNYSTDDTLQVLETFKKEHPTLDTVITREEHHTAGAARNRGFELATGEWVLFFDSDDIMADDLVESYIKVIERADKKGETLDLISARSTLVFPDGRRRRAPFHRGDLFANHILHGQLATQRYAVRREFFASTDGWNIELPGWNDWELGLRLLLASPRVAYMGGPSRVTINHNGADSITGTEFHSRQGQWERVIGIMRNEILSSYASRISILEVMAIAELDMMLVKSLKSYPKRSQKKWTQLLKERR